VRGRYGGLCSLEKLKAQKLKLKKMDPRSWAGMTGKEAKAGIYGLHKLWTPAFAGVTGGVSRG